MPFEKVHATNIAEATAAQIRSLIANDVLRPGDQLPGERELAARLDISRTSLRAALQSLTAEGLLFSKHGSGLFVQSDLGRSLVDPLIYLFQTSEDANRDYINFRRILESESAAIVAEKGTLEEKAHINRIHEDLEAALKAEEPERMIALDEEFHMAIIEATGNIVSIQIARSLSELQKASIEKNHSAAFYAVDGRAEIATQHGAINSAIQVSDTSMARREMSAHLDYFSELIERQNHAIKRQKTVEKRIAWKTSAKS